jgi:hypothetical protein
MTFQYLSIEEAIGRRGLRMVVVGGVPSPWGEAAKGILHVKGIDWAAVRLVYDSGALKDCAGQRNGPVAIYEDERPRSGWAEILQLAERLGAKPSLLPADAAQRALVFGLAHEICGESGLGWSRRLQLIDAGLRNAGGFPERVSKYLGKKYGYSPEAGAAAGARRTTPEHVGGAAVRAAPRRQPLLCRRRLDRAGRLQRNLHDDVCAPSAGAMPDG